jgi:hypothetical protein
VIGSTELVQMLIEHGLVDEFRLILDPVTLGGGKSIFRNDGSLRDLRLIDRSDDDRRDSRDISSGRGLRSIVGRQVGERFVFPVGIKTKDEPRRRRRRGKCASATTAGRS